VALSGVRHAYASSRVFVDFRPVFSTVRHCIRYSLLRSAIRRDVCNGIEFRSRFLRFQTGLFRRATWIIKLDFVPS